jgi:hypothetical protein
MLVSEKDAITRLVSPDNLVNKIRTLAVKKPASMSIFGLGSGSPIVQQVRFADQIKEQDKPSQAESNVSHLESITAEMIPARVPFDPFNHKSSFPVLPPAQQVTLNRETPKVDDLLDNVDTQLGLQQAHDNALKLLGNAVTMLGTKLDDIKPDKLPAVIAAASKTVESIRKEKIELGKTRKERNVHFHFYEPERKQLSDYQVIDV